MDGYKFGEDEDLDKLRTEINLQKVIKGKVGRKDKSKKKIYKELE
jgi:hypothetical protein